MPTTGASLGGVNTRFCSEGKCALDRSSPTLPLASNMLPAYRAAANKSGIRNSVQVRTHRLGLAPYP